MEVSGGGRRRRSLSDENVDFLRVNQDRGGEDGHSSGGQTLAAVLSQKRQPTLLDIIRDDPGSTHHRKTWSTFKDKIRLRRAGAAWTSSVHVPASDVPIPSANRMMSRRQSTRFPTTTTTVVDDDDDPADQNPRNNSMSVQDSMPSNRAMMMRHNSSRLPNLATTSYGRGVEFSTSFNTGQDRDRAYYEGEEEEEGEEKEERELEEEGSEEGGETQVRMSLMALLAETDRQMGLDGSHFIMGDDDEDEDEEEEEVSSGIGEYNNCCVCMVRHKGAAFIPCGHTFCRLCSRELSVQRGNCPLCNNFILEILDIF